MEEWEDIAVLHCSIIPSLHYSIIPFAPFPPPSFRNRYKRSPVSTGAGLPGGQPLQTRCQRTIIRRLLLRVGATPRRPAERHAISIVNPKAGFP
jgi:hypothetical protein